MVLSRKIYQTLSHYQRGKFAELSVAGYLRRTELSRANGYKVIVNHKESDLTIINASGEKFSIEVKFSTLNADNRYKATVYKRGSQNLHDSCFVVFLTQDNNGNIVSYVIPRSIAEQKNSLSITANHTSKRYIPYRENWQQLFDLVKP